MNTKSQEDVLIKATVERRSASSCSVRGCVARAFPAGVALEFLWDASSERRCGGGWRGVELLPDGYKWVDLTFLPRGCWWRKDLCLSRVGSSATSFRFRGRCSCEIAIIVSGRRLLAKPEAVWPNLHRPFAFSCRPCLKVGGRFVERTSSISRASPKAPRRYLFQRSNHRELSKSRRR